MNRQLDFLDRQPPRLGGMRFGSRRGRRSQVALRRKPQLARLFLRKPGELDASLRMIQSPLRAMGMMAGRLSLAGAAG